MDWFNIVIFGVIPVFTVMVVFFLKRKYLWVSPLISTVLAFITYNVAFRLSGIESPLLKIFTNSEWRGFLLLALIMHIVITIILTIITYLVIYVIKQKQKH